MENKRIQIDGSGHASRIIILAVVLFLSICVYAQEPDHDYGDAPEDALAYPSLGVIGWFPTCETVGPPGSFIKHGLCWACFLQAWPGFDFEYDGNAGLCSIFNPNAYNQDECFMDTDGDAGLVFPGAYTIQGPVGSETVVPCPGCAGVVSSLGPASGWAKWGLDIDIGIDNYMPSDGYVNVLIDWDQSGQWGGSATCFPLVFAWERVLTNFIVPMGFVGKLSQLNPLGFRIGPNPGYVWVRFTISYPKVTLPIGVDWDGSGVFEDGETEDYLLHVYDSSSYPDFGDAPDPTYPTLLSNDGARHGVNTLIYLGATIDNEPDGQPDPFANGDDLNDYNDDEDGIVFTSTLTIGQPAYVTVSASISGFLNAWIDFNADGDWADTGEQIFNDESLSAGPNQLTFSVPASVVHDSTFARFRFDTGGGLTFDGLAPDGEVEDYKVFIDTTSTRIEEESKYRQIPSHYMLLQNHPNPFNSETMIQYRLPISEEIVLTVYDIRGIEVRNLEHGIKSAGIHSVIWDGRNNRGVIVPSGVYFYRIHAKAKSDIVRENTVIKKMVFMK